MIDFLRPDLITLSDITSISYGSIGVWFLIAYEITVLSIILKSLIRYDYICVKIKILIDAYNSEANSQRVSMLLEKDRMESYVFAYIAIMFLGFLVPFLWPLLCPVVMWYPIRKVNELRTKKERVMEILRGE